MSIDTSYFNYKITTLADGSRAFFNDYPANNWCFNGATHNDMKTKNGHLDRIPSEIKRYADYLKSMMPTKSELKTHFARPLKPREVAVTT